LIVAIGAWWKTASTRDGNDAERTVTASRVLAKLGMMFSDRHLFKDREDTASVSAEARLVRLLVFVPTCISSVGTAVKSSSFRGKTVKAILHFKVAESNASLQRLEEGPGPFSDLASDDPSYKYACKPT
jgi:hypothetical protein